jgi:hypothetical protein
MMDDVFHSMPDPDGNFVQQFQTDGFDARLFELYLYAFFSRTGYSIDRTHPQPDFLVGRERFQVAVEATTVNQSSNDFGRKKSLDELSSDERQKYVRHELPIRLGSPLLSKLKKQYWCKEHCRGKPFVIALQDFHERGSLALTSSALTGYLFGIEETAGWDPIGNLHISQHGVDEHRVAKKRIPSGFFAQPDCENISAVLFTNAGTTAKFSRMGWQHGFGDPRIHIVRTGLSFNPEPTAIDPTFFQYDLDDPPLVESWGQEIEIIHNPHARHPLPDEFFSDVTQTKLIEGRVASECPSWHPLSSTTLTTDKRGATAKTIFIDAISRQTFREVCPFAATADHPISDEMGWFADNTGSFLGIVTRDKIDDDWAYVVFGRNTHGVFHAIDLDSSLASREDAREKLCQKIVALRHSPQRIFPDVGADS